MMSLLSFGDEFTNENYTKVSHYFDFYLYGLVHRKIIRLTFCY